MSEEHEAIEELAAIVSQAMREGLSLAEVREVAEQEFSSDLVDHVIALVTGQGADKADEPDEDLEFWSRLVMHGRQLLSAGHTTVDLYHVAVAECSNFHQGEPDGGATASRAATEAIASVHEKQVIANA